MSRLIRAASVVCFPSFILFLVVNNTAGRVIFGIVNLVATLTFLIAGKRVSDAQGGTGS